MADQQTLEDADPHEKIVRLEEHIEELAAKLESCRKFILVARIAVAGGGLVLAAMLVGAIRSDLGLMAASVASFLGGIVVWGSARPSAAAGQRAPSAASASAKSRSIRLDSPGWVKVVIDFLHTCVVALRSF